MTSGLRANADLTTAPHFTFKASLGGDRAPNKDGGRVGVLLAFSRAVDRLNAGAAWIATWLVLFACVVSAGNAIVRYLFSYSSNAFLEIQWYSFGALVFLGAAYTLRMNEHVRVDLVYSSLSEEKQVWVDIVGLVLFFLPVTAYLTWISIPLFTVSFRSGEVSSSAGGLTIWPAKLLIPLGFALLLLQGLSELIKRILTLQGRMQLDVKYEKPVQ
ncbi:MAG: transporter small permease subunit [Enterovirga sp.]|jgi:TRAP-type mannitol/chloroaromatic compound transport system permease small subunit|nr:transporter small permease subunit [Enterovirga sp.]